MDNNSALQFFENMSNKVADDSQCVKLSNNTDFTSIDADLILNYANNETTILDIGTGTGLIVNKIFDKVKSIDCVEPFESFTKHIIKSKNVLIINKNIFTCEFGKKYDMVTAFGCMHYFNKEEAEKIYLLANSILKKDGKLIVKNQFGVNDDVIVSGYSEEQKSDYFASYRHIDKKIELIRNIGFRNIVIKDIYPEYANRWENTHFFCVIAQK